MDEFENIVTVIDDDGNEHEFEELDRIETEDGQKYIALIPLYEEDDMSDDEGELIILKVSDDDGETVLEPIENEEEFDEIAAAFEERLAEFFEFEE